MESSADMERRLAHLSSQAKPPKSSGSGQPKSGPGQHAGQPKSGPDLILNSAGKPKEGLANLKTVLSFALEFRGKLKENLLTHVVEVHGSLPWGTGPAVRTWTDNDDVQAAAYVQKVFQFSPTTDQVAKTVAVVGEEHAYHPIRDFLRECKAQWDGAKRLDLWLLDHGQARQRPDVLASVDTIAAIDSHNDYVRVVGRKFLISAVARVVKPGCKVDTMLILQGKQDSKKSTTAKILFEPWTGDELAEIGSKDAAEQLRGIWAIELAELDTFNRAETNSLKAFVSRQSDRYRPAYGRRVQEYPRESVFLGTTNAAAYLKDETGGRRFWPVTVGTIDVEALKRDRVQLWAEAVVAFEAGEQWWLTDEESAQATKEQGDRYVGDAIDAPIAEYLDGKKDVSIPEILVDVFSLHDRSKWDQTIQTRVGKSLRALGWERSLMRMPGSKRERRFKAPAPLFEGGARGEPSKPDKIPEENWGGSGGSGGSSLLNTFPKQPPAPPTACALEVLEISGASGAGEPPLFSSRKMADHVAPLIDSVAQTLDPATRDWWNGFGKAESKK